MENVALCCFVSDHDCSRRTCRRGTAGISVALLSCLQWSCQHVVVGVAATGDVLSKSLLLVPAVCAKVLVVRITIVFMVMKSDAAAVVVVARFKI